MSDRAIALLFACALVAPSLAGEASSGNPTPKPTGCLVAGDGYLRARVRGALDLDLDWKDAQMECEGAPRPSGHGVRVSIGGPLRGDGRRIRLVFGIADLAEGGDGRALRTNVTLLFEGEKRLFATRGDDKCTTDTASQRRVETLGGNRAVYRVVARGFCVGPAANPAQTERVVITSFDFAGRVEFGDDDRHEAPAPSR
ncbi:MAG TPA: hypothetical protein VMF52_09840 [Steroidobacteraceae bacterium]|nr:hypothetical protein [Steroidobacteraceae bacterium]